MTEYSKSIYKLDTHRKVRVLHVYTKGADLVQESGLLDGEKITHRKTCKGKNIGKSNETTPEQQAHIEAAAKIVDKMKSEYFETVEEAELGSIVLPMLAEDYKKKSGKIDWTRPVFVQPKLDGQRALCFFDGKQTGEGKEREARAGFLSRDGRAITTMSHIEDLLCSKLKVPNVILDGELYAHGLSFQENMKLIKKVRPGETEKVCYHVYDLISPDPFATRMAMLADIVSSVNSESLVLVTTEQINSEDDLKRHHALFIGDGYEGSIVRHSDKGYEVNRRSSNLLKYKDFLDLSLPILDIRPSQSVPTQGYPVFHWEGAKDNELKAGMRFSHAEREDFLVNKEKYIGKTAELRFFEYSDEGVPRFPVCVGLRLDK